MSEEPWTDEERAAAVAYLEKWETGEQAKHGRGIRWLCLCEESGRATTADVAAALSTVQDIHEKGHDHAKGAAITILQVVRGRAERKQRMEQT